MLLSRWGSSPPLCFPGVAWALRRLALPAASLPEALVRAARMAPETGQEIGKRGLKVPGWEEKPGRTWLHCWECLGTASPEAKPGMSGTHEAWGLWMLGTLRVSRCLKSGIWEGKRDF